MNIETNPARTPRIIHLPKPERLNQIARVMFARNFLNFTFALVFSLVCVACDKSPEKFTSEKSANTNQQTFQVKGVVKEIKPDGKSALIKHEEIPGYMAAMTMEFETRNTNELRGLKEGDAISFRLNVTDDDGWIDQVKKLNVAPTETPSRATVRIARDVDMLNVGDALPEYHFTNQLGQAVDLRDFKGQALAIDFIFTTCPFPTMCPRLSQNFSDAQKKLKGMPDAPTNWHLLTISFDPERDTPAVLKSYAERYNYDPKHWSFLTGDLIEITAIAEQFGQTFWSEGGSISHNIRTVVIDANGIVQKVIPENKWTSDELVEEIVKAARISK